MIMKDKTVTPLSENHIYLQVDVTNEYEVFYNIKQATSHLNTTLCHTVQYILMFAWIQK